MYEYFIPSIEDQSKFFMLQQKLFFARKTISNNFLFYSLEIRFNYTIRKTINSFLYIVRANIIKCEDIQIIQLFL